MSICIELSIFKKFNLKVGTSLVDAAEGQRIGITTALFLWAWHLTCLRYGTSVSNKEIIIGKGVTKPNVVGPFSFGGKTI